MTIDKSQNTIDQRVENLKRKWSGEVEEPEEGEILPPTLPTTPEGTVKPLPEFITIINIRKENESGRFLMLLMTPDRSRGEMVQLGTNLTLKQIFDGFRNAGYVNFEFVSSKEY
jgi:hypothetical protein